MVKEDFYYDSADKLTKIHAIKWAPEIEAIGVLQIAHGMLEHIDRYDDFAKFLASQGLVVAGNDHLGYGKSTDYLGYFGTGDTIEYAVDDVNKLSLILKEKYDLPIVYIGHSMGSFLVRYFLVKYRKSVDGAIVMGTGYHPIPLAVAGQVIARLITCVKGWHYRSALVNKIAFGSYNKGIKPLRTPSDWISRDEMIVDRYVSDPRCQFVFTVNGFYELFKGIQFISKTKNIEKVPRQMPILFVSGDADPVGDYGEGVQKIYDMFTLAGNEKLDMLMYDGARHEVLNEINRKDVYEDLYTWLNKEISLKH